MEVVIPLMIHLVEFEMMKMKTEDEKLNVSNVITRIIEPKTLTKHISCD